MSVYRSIWCGGLAAAGLFVGLVVLAETPKKDSPKADIRTELMNADRAFAKAAAEKGLDGWMSYMAADAARMVKIGGGIISGTDAIRKSDAAIFANADKKLTWEPVDAHGFADGRSGVSTGRYKVIGKNDDGSEKVWSTGAYVTWWRQEAGGAWKVIFDTGTPDPPVSPKK